MVHSRGCDPPAGRQCLPCVSSESAAPTSLSLPGGWRLGRADSTYCPRYAAPYTAALLGSVQYQLTELGMHPLSASGLPCVDCSRGLSFFVRPSRTLTPHLTLATPLTVFVASLPATLLVVFLARARTQSYPLVDSFSNDPYFPDCADSCCCSSLELRLSRSAGCADSICLCQAASAAARPCGLDLLLCGYVPTRSAAATDSAAARHSRPTVSYYGLCRLDLLLPGRLGCCSAVRT